MRFRDGVALAFSFEFDFTFDFVFWGVPVSIVADGKVSITLRMVDEMI